MSDIGKNNVFNREEWLKNTIKKIPEDSMILDAGAGELKYKKYCSHLNYISQDFNKYDGKGDERGLQTKKWDLSKIDIISDISSIPKPDEYFDAIMCIEVFEHIPNPVLAIKEFFRLLKPGGHLIITAPFCSLTHFAPYHFYSGFNRYFYKKHLPDNGFKIIELVSNGNYFEYLAQEIRRIPATVDKYRKFKKLNIIDLFILKKSLSILEKINRNQKDSNELLCFGYHVYAKKINKK